VATIRELARQGGVDLSEERAAGLVGELEAILEADARILALGLGALRPLGPAWDEDSGD
jgi:hypothetical protein